MLNEEVGKMLDTVVLLLLNPLLVLRVNTGSSTLEKGSKVAANHRAASDRCFLCSVLSIKWTCSVISFLKGHRP